MQDVSLCLLLGLLLSWLVGRQGSQLRVGSHHLIMSEFVLLAESFRDEACDLMSTSLNWFTDLCWRKLHVTLLGMVF